MKPAAAAALRAAEAAVAAGDGAAARRLLDRLGRIGGADPTLALAAATLRLGIGDPAAGPALAAIARRHDVREAWFGLAASALRAGDAAAAAAALAAGLARNAFDPTPELAAFADAIAAAAAAPGWCGLSGTGGLSLQLAGAGAERAELLLGGRPLRLRPEAGADGADAAAPLRYRLPDSWVTAGSLAVRLGERDLLGSPVRLAALLRVEGFVAARDGGLEGWAWSPGDPESPTRLTVAAVEDPRRRLGVIAEEPAAGIEHAVPLARPRRFAVPAERLARFSGLVRVFGRDGRNLYGSPLDPGLERRSAVAATRAVSVLFPAAARPPPAPPLAPMPSVPARLLGPHPAGGARPRPVDVVVPVYRGLEETIACLDSVRAGLPDWARLVVVDDCSPDTELVAALDALAAHGAITLLRLPANRGFPGACNEGMRHDPGRDVVLLNSDTLCPPGWLHRLREIAYSARDIGTATPLSNDATILSYPETDRPNPVPDLPATIARDTLAAEANGGRAVEVPTGVGFCMYVKRDCLDDTGALREDVFAQGYGEENDLCLRARHLGWRHVAAPGVFVAHVGGTSFGGAKSHLIARNVGVLNQLHPGYDALIQEWLGRDPMAEPRRRLDMLRWREDRNGRRSVLLITHGRGGGVPKRIAARASALRAEGLRPIVLWPVANRIEGADCVLGDGPEGGTPNLRFAIPAELDLLAEFLRADRPVAAEVHHLIGHDHAILGLCERLGIRYDAVIHDYFWFCPRITLLGAERRYCGEPGVAHCQSCLADNGTNSEEEITVADLLARSARELGAARRIITPSRDVAARIRRHFPATSPEAVDWENDPAPARPPRLARPVGGRRRVAVVGAISVEKGFEVLLACARDASARDLALEFALVGYSCDDPRLLATGRVHITGAYQEHEAEALIAAQEAHLGLLPAVWPETWCYTLSQAWGAGLDVAVFDIGAPAERIRRAGRGWILPFGIAPHALNNALLTLG